MADPLVPVQPPVSPDAGTSPAHRRLVAVLEVLLCSSIPTQLALGAVLTLAGWAPEAAGADGTMRLSLRYVLVLSLADTVLLVGLMVVLMRVHGERASVLWLGTRPVRREVMLGLVLIPAVFLGVVVALNAVRLLFPALHNVPTNPLEQLAGDTAADAALFGLIAIVAGGVREELQRAFLLHRFEQHLGGAKVGLVVLSAAFGLGHVVQGWDAVIVTGLLGAFWAALYLDRRSSLAPIVSHAGFNALEIVRVVAGVR